MTPCPTGNQSMFGDGPTAARYARNLNARRRPTHGRFISKHCPDCGRFHVWTIAKAQARKRRPTTLAAA